MQINPFKDPSVISRLETREVLAGLERLTQEVREFDCALREINQLMSRQDALLLQLHARVKNATDVASHSKKEI